MNPKTSTEQKEIVDDNKKQSWSIDNKIFCHDTLEDLIDSHIGELNAGDTVYICDTVYPEASEFVDVDDILENMGKIAYEIGGEWAEDFPDANDDAKQGLNNIVSSWIERYCTINFFSVKNRREYVLTQEDLLEKESDE